MTNSLPKVYNKHHRNAPEGAVYIGRGSKWGNPFVIGPNGNRTEVIKAYEEWLRDNPQLLEAIKRELPKKDLVCFCKPAACHGDILLALANQ
jgi:hypothetical protein